MNIADKIWKYRKNNVIKVYNVVCMNIFRWFVFLQARFSHSTNDTG